MCMKTEITAVERIDQDGVISALIKCDMTAALERVYFAQNGSNDCCDTGIELHSEFGTGYLLFGADEVIGLSCGPWQLWVSHEHQGVVISKNQGDYESEVATVELENEWIDVLMIVRNFFALGRAAEPDYSRYL